MSTRPPPVERRDTLASVTVDRSGRGRGGIVKTMLAAILVGLITVGVASLMESGMHGGDLVREARDTVERLMADTGLVPAPSPDPRSTVPGNDALERLHAAVVAGDGDALVALLQQVPAPELDTPLEGMTAVMRAAAAGHADMVRSLVHAGADPGARGRQQRTALQYAAEKNRMKAARMLLDAGADINGVDTGSLSPLVMAADRGYTEFALMLIQRGANVNIQNVDGWTALMDAAELGDARLVEALLAAGAEPGARHRNGWTALDFARHGKHRDVVQLLSPGGKPVSRRRTAKAATTPLPAASTAPSPAAVSAPIPASATLPLPPKKGTRQ